jgi:RNA polymerase sigma factor (sigma-70 family)
MLEERVSDWPSLEHVDDRLLAQELRSGDPSALTRVCASYAARLYDYCHALLRDQESATQTLHDALLAAQSHVGRLRDPQLFRGWLYALVRTECLRRLADPARPTGGQEAPDVEEPLVDAAAEARREETRQLVHSALAGLNGRQREAIDLVLRHHLAPEELAGVLGLSTEQATELAWEAREQLDDAFAAAIMVHGRHSECPSMAALVDPHEWPLSPPNSRTLIRHLASCPVCSVQRRPKASTAELLRVLEVLPVALLPADLEHRVLATATDPALAEQRESIAQAAEPFDEWGWPAAAEPPSRRGGRGPRERDPGGSRRPWPALAAVGGVVIIVGVVYLILPSSSGKPAADTSHAALPSDTALVSPDPSESTIDSPKASPTTTTHSPTPTPTPTPTTHTPTPKVTRTTAKPTKTPTPKGTLQIVGCTITAPATQCMLTATAKGGSVQWQVTGATNGLTASGGGTLTANQSTQVTVSHAACTGAGAFGIVSFSPSGSAKVSWTCDPTPP